ncbi:MAG: P3 [Corparats virus 1]|nr:MAG: P3 [Corparats virus 1]
MKFARALKGQTLTAQLITEIENENFNYLTNNCQVLFLKLKSYAELNELDFTINSEDGLLPNEVYSSVELNYDILLGSVNDFDKSWLITGEYDFEKVTYQYLPTFNLSSYQKQKTLLNEKEQQVYDILLQEKTSQCRFPSVHANWRSLFSSLYVCEVVFGETFLHRLVSTILKKYDEFPFLTTERGTKWLTNDAYSTLPYVIYAINNWCDRLILGELGINDVKVSASIFNWWLKDSLFDSQLKWKGIFTDYMDHAIRLLSTQLIREWNSEAIPIRLTIKTNNVRAYNVEIKQYQEKLSNVPIIWVKNLISGLIMKSKSLQQCVTFGKVLRHYANPALYLTSIVDLTLDDAVNPRMENVLVQKGSYGKHLTNGNVYDFELDLSTKLGRMTKFYSPIICKAKTSYNGYNVQDKAISFLTPQSGGRKDIESDVPIPDKLMQIAGTRLGDALIHHEELGNEVYMLEGATRPTRAGVREQIARRLRAISVIPNPKLLFSFAAYTASLELIKYLNDASSGKQTGHYLDLRYLLMSTGNNRSVLDSIDISGMDASIQPTLYSNFHDIILPVVMSEKNKNAKYFGFHNTIQEINGETKQFSGLCNTIMSSREVITPFGTEVKGKLYTLRGKDYTFPSGVAFTGTHHTLILIGVIRESELRWQKLGKRSNISFINVQGDDVIITYIGKDDDVHLQRKFVEEELSNIGFKTTSTPSPSSGVFLQQCVVGGSYVGYADRLSLCTAERSDWSEDNIDKGQQLSALCADLSSRVNYPENLSLLYLSYCWWMFSRITLPINNGAYEKFIKLVNDEKLRIKVYKIPNYTGSDKINRYVDNYIRIYAPFMLLFHEKGFQANPLSTERLDKTCTLSSSYLTPRGEILRRFRFDIILDNIYKVSNEITSKHIDHIINLGFLSADICQVIFKRSTRNQKFKFDTYFTASDIFVYSERLNQYRDANIISNSKLAAKQLNDYGVSLDDALIEAYQIPVRIRQLAEAQLPNKSEDVNISSGILLDIVKEFKHYRKMLVVEDDVKYYYDLNFSDVIIENNKNVIDDVIFKGCPLSPGVYFNSSVGRCIRGLGFRNNYAFDLNINASVISNKYANGLGDSRLIEAFEEVANKSKQNPSILRLFAVATGIDSRTLNQFITYYNYKDRTTKYRINTSFNPRMYFFTPTTTNTVQNILDYGENVTVSNEDMNGILSIYGLYEYYRTSHLNEQNNKLRIELFTDLLEKLMGPL